MTTSIGPEFTAAFAAIFGSLVGALGSSTSAWINQMHQDRRDLIAKRLVRREALYSDFIHETARLLVDASTHNLGDAQNLIPAYALLSRIRLNSTPDVLTAAEEVLRTIVDTYAKPNLTTAELAFRATGHRNTLLDFSDICRVELELIQRKI